MRDLNIPDFFKCDSFTWFNPLTLLLCVTVEVKLLLFFLQHLLLKLHDIQAVLEILYGPGSVFFSQDSKEIKRRREVEEGWSRGIWSGVC